jgi:hypothetical protein
MNGEIDEFRKMIEFVETKRDKLQKEVDIRIEKRDGCLKAVETIEANFNANLREGVGGVQRGYGGAGEARDRPRAAHQAPRQAGGQAQAHCPGEPDGQRLPHNAHQQQGVGPVVQCPGNRCQQQHNHYRGFHQTEPQILRWCDADAHDIDDPPPKIGKVKNIVTDNDYFSKDNGEECWEADIEPFMAAGRVLNTVKLQDTLAGPVTPG